MSKSKPVGYIVLLKTKGCEYEPCSFGIDGEPEPEILAKRGRATIFAKSEHAATAIDIAYSMASAEGHQWVRGAKWIITPVFRDVPNQYTR